MKLKTNTQLRSNAKTNILVGLDLTEMDKIVIEYISFLTNVLEIDQVYFIHNIKQLDVMDILEEYIKEDSLEEIIDKELNKTINTHYKSDTPFELLVSEDNYTESLITYISTKYEINWVMLGLKNEMQGTGGLSQKLVRMLTCSLLLIPENAPKSIEKILIPTDFSAPAARTFQVAKGVAESFKSSIDVLHVFNIPSFFFPYIDNKKAIDKTSENSQERYSHFIKKNKVNTENMCFNSIYQGESSVVDIIVDTIRKKDINMVILAARGANKLTSLFVGSTTQGLILKNLTVPLFIIK